MGDTLFYGIVGDVPLLLYVRYALLSLVQGPFLRNSDTVLPLVLRHSPPGIPVVLYRGIGV